MTLLRLGSLTSAITLVLAMSGTAAQQPAPPAVTCVALALPSVQGVDGDATSVSEAVRDLFASYLKGPTIRTAALESRLASQAVIEAGALDCGSVLLVTIERKRAGRSSVGRVLGQAAGAAAARAPIYGGATAAVAGSATWAGGEALYRFSSEVRAKDELVLSYRLGPPATVEGTRPVTTRLKATSDGEDILTPLVEKASGEIAVRAGRGGR